MEAIKMKKDNDVDTIDVTSLMSMLSDKKILKKQSNVVELNAVKNNEDKPAFHAANDTKEEGQVAAVNSKTNPALKSLLTIFIISIVGYLLYAVFSGSNADSVHKTNDIDWDGVRNILAD